MDVRTIAPGVKLLTPRVFSDGRGDFFEVWNDAVFRREVADVGFVQDNQSRSAKRGTVRGLHAQRPPWAQGKLLRIVRGAIFDVFVDIRHGSPDYRRHGSIELTAESRQQLWIPPGFLHGFCTLTDDCEVAYKATGFYRADHEVGVVWDDPALAIAWPVAKGDAILSERDAALPRFEEFARAQGERP